MAASIDCLAHVCLGGVESVVGDVRVGAEICASVHGTLAFAAGLDEAMVAVWGGHFRFCQRSERERVPTRDVGL